MNLPGWFQVILAVIGLLGPPIGVYVTLSNDLTKVATIVEQRQSNMDQQAVFQNKISNLQSQIAVLEKQIETLEKDKDMNVKAIAELKDTVRKLEMIVSFMRGEIK